MVSLLLSVQRPFLRNSHAISPCACDFIRLRFKREIFPMACMSPGGDAIASALPYSADHQRLGVSLPPDTRACKRYTGIE